MGLLQTMKAGPSTTQAAWSTTTPRTKHSRNFIVAASTVIILAFLYIFFGSTSVETFRSRWSLQFGNGGNGQGDQYLLGVGKADITGY